jgi:hypothetical protein
MSVPISASSTTVKISDKGLSKFLAYVPNWETPYTDEGYDHERQLYSFAILNPKRFGYGPGITKITIAHPPILFSNPWTSTGITREYWRISDCRCCNPEPRIYATDFTRTDRHKYHPSLLDRLFYLCLNNYWLAPRRNPKRQKRN